MKFLLLLAALFAACSSPKTYTKPEIGMDFIAFDKLCDADPMSNTNTVTNSEGETLTIKLNPTPYPLTNEPKTRIPECVGTFTFVNGKLGTITH